MTTVQTQLILLLLRPAATGGLSLSFLDKIVYMKICQTAEDPLLAV